MASSSPGDGWSAADGEARILKWAQASGKLSKDDLFELDVCCEAAKECMQASCTDLLKQAQGLAILNSKSSDGTPMSVQRRTSWSLHSMRHVRTSNKEAVDFLVKNQFVRVRIGSNWHTRAVLQEAMPLSNGKSVPAIQGCQLRDWRTLRQVGHAGPSVEHYAFDRCGFTAMERFLRQWHQHWPTKHDLPKSDFYSAAVMEDLEFVVFTPCALHDTQNSFKWAMQAEMANTEVLRDCYIAIESLKGGRRLDVYPHGMLDLTADNIWPY